MRSTVLKNRTTIAGLAALLGAVVLAAGCREPVGPSPEHQGPGLPRFAVAASGGIALDQQNGKLGETTTIWQGFHPTNPHLGDAVVVTFYWVGSTNIIARVYDHLGDGTPVGNTYTLVEYVTGGGVSMATYVATNVQGFPEGTDPNGNTGRRDFAVVVYWRELSDRTGAGSSPVSLRLRFLVSHDRRSRRACGRSGRAHVWRHDVGRPGR